MRAFDICTVCSRESTGTWISKIYVCGGFLSKMDLEEHASKGQLFLYLTRILQIPFWTPCSWITNEISSELEACYCSNVFRSFILKIVFYCQFLLIKRFFGYNYLFYFRINLQLSSSKKDDPTKLNFLPIELEAQKAICNFPVWFKTHWLLCWHVLWEKPPRKYMWCMFLTPWCQGYFRVKHIVSPKSLVH